MISAQATAWLKPYEPYEAKPLGSKIYKLITTNPAAPNKEMVVKVLNSKANDQTNLQLFLRLAQNEYDQMKNLKSIPQVVQVYDRLDYEDAGLKWVCILMEYCGESLSQHIANPKKPKLSYDEKINILYQLALGLKGIQDKKTAHFDIKPDNVTYYNGKVKIIDFGTAVESGSTTQFAKLGSTGTVLGYTELFAPPEVINTAKVQRDKIDVYCFGRTGFQLFFDIPESQLKEYFLQYAEKISEKPLVYKINEAKYSANFLSLLKGKKYPDDPSDGFLSERINSLLSQALDINPGKRPTFEFLLGALEHIRDPPPLRLSCYKDCEKCYTIHPSRGVLYAVNRTLGAPGSDVVRETESWPIACLAGYTRFASIFFPPKHVFVFGGKKSSDDCLGTIFAVDVTTRAGTPQPASLRTPRLDATLVTDGTSIYVLGGEGKENTLLNSCEEFIQGKAATDLIAPLNENKARMAACVLNGECIYVFGGEMDNYLDESCTSLIHNYSTKVEMLNLRDKSKWLVVEISNAATTEWNGCGLSGACQVGESILICGGFIRAKNKEYSWNLDQVAFDPKKREFGPIEQKLELIVEFFMNSIYCIKENTLLASTTFTCGEKDQSFYSFNPSTKSWSLHMLT